MRGFLAVASREIARRSGVFVAAAATAVFPFLVPLIPGRHAAAQDLRMISAAVLALAFSAAFSLILGMTALGHDLSEGRLGFYFSRPIAGTAIWAGKLAGASLVVLLSTAIVLLPEGLFDLRFWLREARSGFGPLSLLTSAVIVFLALGSVGSLALRSRSVWVAADLAALALWTGLMGAIARPLLVAQEPLLLRNLGLAVAACSGVALLAAGGAQVSIGRVDAVRGNRARFAALWGLLFAIAGLFFASVRWLVSPAPKDLVSELVGCAAPRGSWIEVEGRARGRANIWASFFYDVASGRSVRGRVGREGAVAISEDGTTAAWTEPSSILTEGLQDVWTCRLAATALRRVRTPISARIDNIELSPDGSRLTVHGDGSFVVYEIPSGRLLASLPPGPNERFSRVVFLERDRLRIYRMPYAGAVRAREEPASIEVLDFEVSARKLTQRATIAPIHRPFALTFDDRAGRVIVWERGSSLSLFDLTTGGLVAVLGNVGWDVASRAFLSDGRIAVAEASGGTGRIHLFSKEGRPGRVFEVGRAGVVRLGAEPSAGTLVFSISPTAYDWGASDSFLLDLEAGTRRKLASHLEPVAARMRWRLPRPEPGSVASLLFSRNDGSLLRLDPETGRLKTLFPPR
jgi:hypothetical protein